MATPLNLVFSGGFSVFLAAIISTILILLIFERKFISEHKGVKWVVMIAIAHAVFFAIYYKPWVVPFTGVALVLFLLPFAFALLMAMFLGGKYVFKHSTSKFLSIGLAIIAVAAISYGVGDKILSVSEKNIVLGTGDAAFAPFGMPVLGMALFFTLAALLVYSFVKS